MLLSDRDILQAMDEGSIEINPFEREQLQSNGYDVRVDSTYYELKREVDAFFPFTEEFVENAYEKKKARVKEVNVNGRKARGKFIRLPPHGFILASTIERTKTIKDITASLRCRSSLARTAISIARCAGWGDVGYGGVWTMEIVNHLKVPYYLPVGLRVGQLVFFKTKTPPENPYEGKYSGSREPALPRLYNDKDFEELIEIRE
ncbi:hypothetical protein AKJ48_01165 [candidate division MSBL1 archaeon SCGC-AAA261O19]|uniref:Uncharacterized protein n=1 Tax=candidate division MSBL1 archaeon SCGC-AAA261O19 TaxID=1698277 RepID=A0A133VEG0_9EURY|nr:hypothetical protein AKJ48_01165 [candidate division MSBL1 archaeon SCGC-AAA261O19]